MQDKVALVTGADAGIGRAIALALAENGASLAAANVRNITGQSYNVDGGLVPS